MRQHLDILDPFGEYLVWTEAVIDDGRHAATFYYRNIINYVRYWIRQVASRSDMVYTPIREYDSSGDRVYSEMHTADWWWDTQVEIGPDKFQVVGVSSANSPLCSLVENAARLVNSCTHYRIVGLDSTYQFFRRYENLAGICDDRQYPFADEKQTCQDGNPAFGIASGPVKVHW